MRRITCPAWCSLWKNINVWSHTRGRHWWWWLTGDIPDRWHWGNSLSISKPWSKLQRLTRPLDRQTNNLPTSTISLTASLCFCVIFDMASMFWKNEYKRSWVHWNKQCWDAICVTFSLFCLIWLLLVWSFSPLRWSSSCVWSSGRASPP